MKTIIIDGIGFLSERLTNRSYLNNTKILISKEFALKLINHNLIYFTNPFIFQALKLQEYQYKQLHSLTLDDGKLYMSENFLTKDYYDIVSVNLEMLRDKDNVTLYDLDSRVVEEIVKQEIQYRLKQDGFQLIEDNTWSMIDYLSPVLDIETYMSLFCILQPTAIASISIFLEDKNLAEHFNEERFYIDDFMDTNIKRELVKYHLPTVVQNVNLVKPEYHYLRESIESSYEKYAILSQDRFSRLPSKTLNRIIEDCCEFQGIKCEWILTLGTYVDFCTIHFDTLDRYSLFNLYCGIDSQDECHRRVGCMYLRYILIAYLCNTLRIDFDRQNNNVYELLEIALTSKVINKKEYKFMKKLL